MAYRCSSCRKVSREKQKKPINKLFSKHMCPGCGSTNYHLISDPYSYDFEELIIEGASLAQKTPDFYPFSNHSHDNNDRSHHSPAFVSTFSHQDSSFSSHGHSSHNSHHDHSHSSHDYSSHHDSGSSWDSGSSCDSGGCDCGGGD